MICMLIRFKAPKSIQMYRNNNNDLYIFDENATYVSVIRDTDYNSQPNNHRQPFVSIVSFVVE